MWFRVECFRPSGQIIASSDEFTLNHCCCWGCFIWNYTILYHILLYYTILYCLISEFGVAVICLESCGLRLAGFCGLGSGILEQWAQSMASVGASRIIATVVPYAEYGNSFMYFKYTASIYFGTRLGSCFWQCDGSLRQSRSKRPRPPWGGSSRLWALIFLCCGLYKPEGRSTFWICPGVWGVHVFVWVPRIAA